MKLDILYNGWLPKNDTLPWTINGIIVDPATKTRREEYHWAASYCRGSLILDAATGYIPTWHELPNILTRKHAGRIIVTIDMDPQTLLMPEAPDIIRMLGNLTSLPYANAAFDTVYCISTLEHLTSEEELRAAAAELLRVCKRRLVLTADLGNWLPTLFGLSPGILLPQDGMLSPPVYALAMDVSR